MLEIFLIIMLCKKHKAILLNKGRKPGPFIALTVILWFGLEFLSIIIGVMLELGPIAFIFVIPSAALGALISYLIVRNCAPGSYFPNEFNGNSNQPGIEQSQFVQPRTKTQCESHQNGIQS